MIGDVNRDSARLVAVRLLPELTDAVAQWRMLAKRILFLGALSAFLIAVARPQLGFVEQDFMQRGRDIVLAIDTSKSMSSTDYAPDRMTRAKLAAQDIMNAMKGDRFGLVAFAGAAQVEAPLTDRLSVGTRCDQSTRHQNCRTRRDRYHLRDPIRRTGVRKIRGTLSCIGSPDRRRGS